VSEGGDAAAFIRANTALVSPPLLPELKLHLATELTPLWLATETTLAQSGLPPPYWAFAWVGGQALARHLLDHPALARGRRLLDFAAGSGVAGIAAAKAGAASVAASELDPLALAALALNAQANDVTLDLLAEDVMEGGDRGWDLVLAGDVCYERPMAERAAAWLGHLAAGGVEVLLADPGRAYLPKSGLVELARYMVPTSRELEDRDSREAVVYRMAG
jgi:predicted nicotinamide N-methyase